MLVEAGLLATMASEHSAREKSVWHARIRKLRGLILVLGGLDWHDVIDVAHYYLLMDAVAQPMRLREEWPACGGRL